MSEFADLRRADLAGSLYASAPVCYFYLRIPVTDNPPTYRYEHLAVRGEEYGQAHGLITPYPPAVGDLEYLPVVGAQPSGNYRVIDRSWHRPMYDSAHWPASQPWPLKGPRLNLIVVPTTGPFHDETAEPEEPPNPARGSAAGGAENPSPDLKIRF